MTARPPPISWPVFSNPPTSSPCQQWSEIAIVESRARAASTSTPHSAYCSLRTGEGSFRVSAGKGHGVVLRKSRNDGMLSSAQFCPNAGRHARDSPGPKTEASGAATCMHACCSYGVIPATYVRNLLAV